MSRVQRQWSNGEVNYIRMHYKDMSDSEMAEILGRTVRSVETMRRRLGLKKTKNGRPTTD